MNGSIINTNCSISSFQATLYLLGLECDGSKKGHNGLVWISIC